MRQVAYFLLGSIFMITTQQAVAFQGTIRGEVITTNGDRVADAHLYISEKKWAVSDKNGLFEISGVPTGNVDLKVSRIGFSARTLSIEIVPDTLIDLSIVLKERIYKDAPVVVTAARTKQQLEDVSVPVTVIQEDEIAASGHLRLSDILQEQVGLNLVSDHGTGIQVQGFDPEYTLIMIDNQPVIGRTAGTLDLTRLAVGNIKQIEMVKGPSSALWGSDALAGVINIITEKGTKPFAMDVSGRYGSNESYDASTNLAFKKNDLSTSFFANINGSGGYDLNTGTVAPTIPEFSNYTFSGRINYRANEHLTFNMNARYYREDQFYQDEILDGRIGRAATADEFQNDYSITPEALITVSDRQLIQIMGYFSRFNSRSDMVYDDTGEIYINNTFDQALNRMEVQSSTFWADDHTTISGVGMNRESLTSEIYSDVPAFNSYFLYGQHEWMITEQFSATTGFRFDAHSEYSSQLSPKFSMLYKPSSKIHLRASLGGGFKAPDFRQLFLNFTNPIAGYSVFGTSTVEEGLDLLVNSGQVAELYVTPEDFEEINAERSFAYNAGIDYFPVDGIQLKLNVFRNNVNDLIETQRIALKNNGQSVFTYFNFDRIFTQGAEFELRYEPWYFPGFRLSLGYQYLDAQREIERTFDDVVDGQVISVTQSDFIPLLNRSNHTTNMRAFYLMEKTGIEASLRLQFRSRFWFADTNNNLRDETSEYALVNNGISDIWNRTIINAAVAKTFYNDYRLQVGVNNMNNFTDERFLPSNPGLTFFTQLTINIK